ncbi:hypothetical protein JMJ77_0014975 [Colletotrichum scovillei]|uniref:Uncharacterized protein n=1 Tax=Colletotrichum scovillei TaxID=1209932 RepID=A0A9P7R0T5_9PEZI|nr:hypothetical protein JMJ77_0014975 [Colletotrichum scovillei]KAG7056625.1 hypothetical protein JMJ78_0000420 [Colletotrichum scovillei]KAG7066518.1 hypothetical protein JMJ76_0000377 [Colletotrichum scovillei]
MLVPSLKIIVTLGVAFYATAALAAPNVQMGADVQDLSERNEGLEQPDFDAVAGLDDTIEARGKPPRRPNNNNNNRRPNRQPNGKPRRPPK